MLLFVNEKLLNASSVGKEPCAATEPLHFAMPWAGRKSLVDGMLVFPDGVPIHFDSSSGQRQLEGLREGEQKLEGRKYEEERTLSGPFVAVEQHKSNEGRSMREVLSTAGAGSLTLSAEGLVRGRPRKMSLSNRERVAKDKSHRARARQSEREARARTQAARAAVASAVATIRTSIGSAS